MPIVTSTYRSYSYRCSRHAVPGDEAMDRRCLALLM
jgi:hypothetical protein